MSKDDLGDRMKGYESVETGGRFDRNLPLYIRIDGRSFSKFTRDMKRPFDERMSRAMIETTRYLVEKTNARIGYVQSDEISLVLSNGLDNSEFMFDGKKQKIVSVLAGMATAAFMGQIMNTNGFEAYADRLPHFDARAFSVPSETEAANAILWRALDARKNAISMAAHHCFSHKILQGKNSKEKLAMLEQDGIVFNHYPEYFTSGTFLRRVTEERTLTEDERMMIPERHRPAIDAKFLRSSVVEMAMPYFVSVTNREGVIFSGDDPVVFTIALDDVLAEV